MDEIITQTRYSVTADIRMEEGCDAGQVRKNGYQKFFHSKAEAISTAAALSLLKHKSEKIRLESGERCTLESPPTVNEPKSICTGAAG